MLRPNASGELTASDSEVDFSSSTEDDSTAASPAEKSQRASPTTSLEDDQMFPFDLEISSVYKPVLPIPSDAPRSWEETQEKHSTHHTKKGTKSKVKKLEMDLRRLRRRRSKSGIRGTREGSEKSCRLLFL